MEILFPEFTVASFSTYKLKLISRVLSLSSLFNFQGPLCALSRVLSDYITSFRSCQEVFLIFFDFFFRLSSLSETVSRSRKALGNHTTFASLCQALFLLFLHFFRRARSFATALSSACKYYHKKTHLSTLFLNFLNDFFNFFIHHYILCFFLKTDPNYKILLCLFLLFGK